MRAFISYVKEDREQVYKIVEHLNFFNIDCWFDKDDLKVGENFKIKIQKAISSGDFFIACFSKNYFKRNNTYMNDELRTAIDEIRLRPMDSTWFLPVLLSECRIPEFIISSTEKLTDFQWLSLYEDFETGMYKLIEAISPTAALKKVTKLLKELKSEDIDIQKAAQKQISNLPRIPDKKITCLLVEAFLSEKTSRTSARKLELIIRRYKSDILPLILKWIVNKYKNKEIDRGVLIKLASLSYRYSIAEYFPGFTSVCQENNISYRFNWVNNPQNAWHLSHESYIRLKEFFEKEERYIWYNHNEKHALTFDVELRNLDICEECGEKEGICVGGESYYDSGESGILEQYICAFCGNRWSNDATITGSIYNEYANSMYDYNDDEDDE